MTARVGAMQLPHRSPWREGAGSYTPVGRLTLLTRTADGESL